MRNGCRLKVLADFAVTMLDEFKKYAAKGKDGTPFPAHFFSGYQFFYQCGSAKTSFYVVILLFQQVYSPI